MTQNTTLSNWVYSKGLGSRLVNARAVVARGHGTSHDYVHVIGGHGVTGLCDEVRSARLDLRGDLGSWVASAALPERICMTRTISASKSLYVLGGYSSTGYSDRIYKSTPDAQGLITSWALAGTLPVTVCNSDAVVHKSHVYLAAGSFNGQVTDQVMMATLDDQDNLSRWVTLKHLPKAIFSPQLFLTHTVIRTQLHVIGRCEHDIGVGLSYSASVNMDGTLGAWVCQEAIPVGLSSNRVAVFGSQVFSFGGISNCMATDAVYSTAIDQAGKLDKWTQSSSLPYAISGPCMVAANNKVHLIGGFVDSKSSGCMYTANVQVGRSSTPTKSKVQVSAPKSVFPLGRWKPQPYIPNHSTSSEF
jgi:hypothetical protein